MKKFILGVDVGGTNVKLGILDPDANIIARSRFSTKPFTRSKSQLIAAIAENVLALFRETGLRKSQLGGVGVGLPGPIDAPAGIVRYLPNVPGWRNVPFAAILSEALGLPVKIDNDVNMIALGEWQFGAGKGLNNFICITLGTGVGGGLIFNGQMYRGEAFAAGEIGHMPLIGEPVRASGKFPELEDLVGNRHLVALANQLYDSDAMSIEEMYRRANAGEEKALKFWDVTATRIGYGLAGAVTLLNPHSIVIGGGVANNFKFLKPTIKRVIEEQAMAPHGRMVKIVRAKLGDDAGLIGARVLFTHA